MALKLCVWDKRITKQVKVIKYEMDIFDYIISPAKLVQVRRLGVKK